MTVKNGPNTETPAFEKQKGKGRPKGVPNKTTAKIKDMIVQALDNKGGVKYLMQQAEDNPVAFMGLVAKVLPMQITGEDGGAIRVAKISLVAKID